MEITLNRETDSISITWKAEGKEDIPHLAELDEMLRKNFMEYAASMVSDLEALEGGEE